MSRKSERLVNLTIALLATKRWLTKSQIFDSIDGYEGEDDAKERMFERDKDDLRNLGITIEVGTFDPLFEDEVGYRIRPESYRANLTSITSRELSLLSLATQAWQGAVLDSTALSGLIKLKSLGIDSDMDSIPAISPTINNPDSNFLTVINAISHRQVITFTYLSADYESQIRTVQPYGAGTKSGYWYVAGFDLDRNQERLFRLDRIDSEIKLQGRISSYEIPEDFLMANALASPEKDKIATIKVRRGKAHSLRVKSRLVLANDDWDTIEIEYLRDSEILADVLWHGSDAVILAPESLRNRAIETLQEIVKLHG